MDLRPLVAFLVYSGNFLVSHAYTPDDETRLKADVFASYDRTVRPAASVDIMFGFYPVSLNELSIDKQEMSVTGTILATCNILTYNLPQSWTDPRLTWNSGNYSNISSVVLESGTVWEPPLYIENTVEDTRPIGSEEKTPLRVFDDGLVLWLVLINSRVTCEIAILAYPFDTQRCAVQVYAWGYYAEEVNLTHSGQGLNTSLYSQNGEWNLVGTNVFSQFIGSSTGSFEEVHSEMTFQRKWIFLSLTLIVPAVLNSFLMCAVYALPFESGEKLGYSLTVLLTYIVLLTLVADNLPPISTETSVLQIYLTGVMCLGTCITLSTVWTVMIYNQDPAKPRSQWVIFVCQRILKPCTYLGECSKRAGRRNKVAAQDGPDNSNDNGQRNISGAKLDILRTADCLSDVDKIKTAYGSYRPNSCSHRPSVGHMTNGHAVFEDKSLHKNLGVDVKGDKTHEPNTVDDERNNQDITWIEVAKLVDAFCLRLVGSVVLAGTTAVIIFFGVTYD